jgi:hypothetical protein
MELAVKLAWLALGLIHLLPAASAFSPSLVERLYGLEPSGDLAVIVAHRGVLFCAIVTSCAFGAFDPAARRALGVVVGISIVGFLALYLRAGLPAGPLRTIAIVDAVGLTPLALVLWSAWRGPAT